MCAGLFNLTHDNAKKLELDRILPRRACRLIHRSASVVALLILLDLPTINAQNLQTTFEVIDGSTLLPTSARVKILENTNSIRETPAQSLSVMYGLWDHADGYAFQPDSSFYVNGQFTLSLKPGKYKVKLSKGFEYRDTTMEVTVDDETQNFRFEIHRWINMQEKHWFSADDHIHLRRSPGENGILTKWLEAENLNVGVFLKMGDFWATYYDQYAFGKKGVHQRDDFMIVPGQEEPRTPELGHALSFGATDYVRNKDYYLYDLVFDRLHQSGGITGYAHQAQTFHGYRGLILDGLRNKVDMLELIQYCAAEDPLFTKYYYHLLDLGIPITAVAGSDFPWCGHDHNDGGFTSTARIGNVRFYTYVDGALTFETWKKAVSKGRTFATNGPLLMFAINDSLPGSTLALPNAQSVTIKARAYGNRSMAPIQRVDIISHGQVIASSTEVETNGENVSISLSYKHPVKHGQWICAVAYGPGNERAHTSPIYIAVGGKGFHNPNTVSQYLLETEKYLDEIRKEIELKSDNVELGAWRYRKPLEQRIKAVESIIEKLRQNLH